MVLKSNVRAENKNKNKNRNYDRSGKRKGVLEPFSAIIESKWGLMQALFGGQHPRTIGIGHLQSGFSWQLPFFARRKVPGMEAWQVHFKWSHFPLFRNSLGCHTYIHGHIICISGSSSFFFPDSFLYQEIKGWDQWLHCTTNFLWEISSRNHLGTRLQKWFWNLLPVLE